MNKPLSLKCQVIVLICFALNQLNNSLIAINLEINNVQFSLLKNEIL